MRCSILAVLLLLALFISCKKGEVVDNGVASARLVNTIAAANHNTFTKMKQKLLRRLLAMVILANTLNCGAGKVYYGQMML